MQATFLIHKWGVSDGPQACSKALQVASGTAAISNRVRDTQLTTQMVSCVAKRDRLFPNCPMLQIQITTYWNVVHESSRCRWVRPRELAALTRDRDRDPGPLFALGSKAIAARLQHYPAFLPTRSTAST